MWCGQRTEQKPYDLHTVTTQVIFFDFEVWNNAAG